MLRLVRSALRTADRLIQANSSSPTTKLKQPLNNFIHNLRGGATHTNVSGSRGLSTSTLPYSIPRYAHQSPPFKSTLSLPARVALGRPLSTPFVPRTPALPRCVTQVGLGTARNFSSTRHVFQNLVENVPIAGRAWYEAGWEVKTDKRRSVMRKRAKKAKATKIADKAKATDASSALTASITSATEEEIDQYFSTAASRDHVEGTTTYLTIPLYPSAQRTPLPHISDSSSRLLPLSELRDIHGDHSLHAVRVSSLFTRLDAGDVWTQGVECECYGSPTTTSAPTALRVVFKGWTRAMVLDVIGEAGMGWCELSEESAIKEEALVPEVSQPTVTMTAPQQIDPTSMSFIIPTLDFSSSFLSQAPTQREEARRPVSPCLSDWTPLSTQPSSPSLTAITEEGFSDGDTELDEWGYSSDEEPRELNSSLNFSVDFLNRGPLGGPPPPIIWLS